MRGKMLHHDKINKGNQNNFIPHWNLSDVIKVFVISAILMFCIGVIEIILFPNITAVQRQYFIIGDYTVLYIVVILWIKKFYHGKIRDLGLFLPINWKKLSIIGIIIGCAFFFLTIASNYYSYFLEHKISIKKILMLFLLVPFTVRGFSMIFLGPFVEEVFYRGFLYPPLKNKVRNTSLAILISAFIFALLHLDFLKEQFIFSFTTHFIAGVVFTFLYQKYRSLIPCIFAHSAMGYLSVLIMAIVK